MEGRPGALVIPDASVRTYLELRDIADLQRVPVREPSVRVEEVVGCPASFWRYLYTEVGRAYHWIDRLPWTDDQIRAYLAEPEVSLWLMTVAGAPAGYFELRRDRVGGTEIAYFGLLPEFTGRGLGGYLLTVAVEQAWSAGTERIWLHTNTLDHPAALPNYLKRGFRAFHSETYTPGAATAGSYNPEE
jgi:GNAT superfamily N-acetyltransferase